MNQKHMDSISLEVYVGLKMKGSGGGNMWCLGMYQKKNV